MSEQIVTSPIITDETGQDILDKLDAIVSALNPNAQGVSFDKTGCEIITANNVQGALTQLDSGLDDTNASLTQNIVTEVVEVGTQTIAQNARGVFTANVAKTGYTPIGIVKIALSSNYMVIGGYTVNDAGNLQIVIWNYDTSRSQTVYATILYKKNS